MKQTWPYWLIGIVAVSLVVTAVLRLLTPPLVEVPETSFVNSNLDGTSSQFGTVTFTGTAPEVPPKLPVLQIISNRTGGRNIAQQVIDANNLRLVPGTTNIWQGDNGELLEFNLYTKDYSFFPFQTSRDAGLTPSINSPTTSESIEIAQNFILQNLSDQSFKPLTNQVRFILAKGDETATSEEDAELVVVPFAQFVGDYPIYYEKKGAPPFAVTVLRATGGISNFSFSEQLITAQPLGETETITFDQALTNIKASKASVVSAFVSEPAPIDLKTLREVVLTTAGLEYRQDSQTKLIYPFFRFKGTAQNEIGTELTIDVITPAIVTKKSTQQ